MAFWPENQLTNFITSDLSYNEKWNNTGNILINMYLTTMTLSTYFDAVA